MNECCRNCRFWDSRERDGYIPEDLSSIDGLEEFWCRRYPPELHEEGYSGFPTTFNYEWCGEFQLFEELVKEGGEE
jgi:hypothetical protein